MESSGFFLPLRTVHCGLLFLPKNCPDDWNVCGHKSQTIEMPLMGLSVCQNPAEAAMGTTPRPRCRS